MSLFKDKKSIFGHIYLILPQIQQVKPFTLHCSLLFFVFAYALSGGLIFNRLEAEPTREHQRREWEKKQECVLEV